jgi:Predicted transcriptional regulator
MGGLSRREREIMDALYRLRGRATAAEIHAALLDPPSYSAVRAHLAILEEKGHVRHEEDGRRYVYLPTQPRQEAARNALRGVLGTFFGGSLGSAVRTLLSDDETDISDEELDELARLINAARGETPAAPPAGEEGDARDGNAHG